MSQAVHNASTKPLSKKKISDVLYELEAIREILVVMGHHQEKVHSYVIRWLGAKLDDTCNQLDAIDFETRQVTIITGEAA